MSSPTYEVGEVLAKGGHRLTFLGELSSRAIFLPDCSNPNQAQISHAPSVVLMGYDTVTGDQAALKVFRRDGNGLALFDNEVAILNHLPAHDQVVDFFGSGEIAGKWYIALEYFPQPSMSDYLKETGPLPEKKAVFILHQMADVLEFLLRNNVAHRDIKPDNVLINPTTLKIKLIDFGLGSFIDNEETADTAFVGTPIYMSPQILMKQEYSVIASDVWSLGMLFLELLDGVHPFAKAKTMEELFALIDSLPERLERYSPKVQRIIKALLTVDEDARPTIDRVCNMLNLYSPPKHSREDAKHKTGRKLSASSAEDGPSLSI